MSIVTQMKHFTQRGWKIILRVRKPFLCLLRKKKSTFLGDGGAATEANTSKNRGRNTLLVLVTMPERFLCEDDNWGSLQRTDVSFCPG